MRIALVVADSVRADAPGWGGGSAHTPFWDKLASEGTVFANAHSCAPWTVPSMASIVTGVYAHRLGLYRWEQPIPASYDTLFSVFADHGYQVASFVFDPSYLFCSMPEARVLGSSQHFDQVFDWISRCTAPDLFVLIHYWGTHFPYLDHPMTVPMWKDITDRIIKVWNSDPTTMTPKIKALYHRSVQRFSERFLPRLVESITAHGDQGACVAITADHGDSWGERTEAIRDVFDMHGNHLRNEVLRVPLVLWESGLCEHRAVKPLVRLVDLAPTLVELAGIGDPWLQEPESAIDGRSLFALMRGHDGDQERSAFACSSRDFVASTSSAPTTPLALWTAVCRQRGSWKLVWDLGTGARTVFDLGEDAGEQRPLPPGSGESVDGWDELESEWKRATCARPPEQGEYQLRSLGYLE